MGCVGRIAEGLRLACQWGMDEACLPKLFRKGCEDIAFIALAQWGGSCLQKGWLTDVAERRDVLRTLDPVQDLGGFELREVRCRSCSGYGNCGYRMYRLNEGKPVSICQLRKKELLEQREGGDAKL